MKTYTITMGRNIKTNPMTLDQWNGAKSFLERIVKDSADEIYTMHAEGYGLWDGMKEESVSFTFGMETPSDLLRAQLRLACEIYQQDAIALVVGETEFVKP